MTIIDQYRDYQLAAHVGVQQSYKAGHRRIMLMLATGAGKSLIGAGMIERSMQSGRTKTGRPALFIVPKITLAEQAARGFRKFGWDVSILQADHPEFDGWAPLQVCSAQTLERKPDLFDEASIVIIDEAHIKRKFYSDMMTQWPDTPFIGLSATPTSKGLGLIYDDLVVGATTGELVQQGWLMPSKIYEPSVYDVTGVKGGRGESGYNDSQLGSAIDGQKEITGNIIENWIERGENRQTLCFPVNISHSKYIVSRFIASGVSAMHIDGNTTMEFRDEAFEQMRRGELKLISSVGCLTEGLDITSVSCLILARPVKSIEPHIQMLGRGLRPHMLAGDGVEGQCFDLAKTGCTIFDHGGNVMRLCHHEDYEPGYLHCSGSAQTKKDYVGKDSDGEVREPAKCKQCHAVKPRGLAKCPYCQYMPLTEASGVTERPGELRLTIGGRHKDQFTTPAERKIFYAELKGVAMIKRYKPAYAACKYKDKFGDWPPRSWRDSVSPINPTLATDRWCKSQNIRHHKGRGKAA